MVFFKVQLKSRLLLTAVYGLLVFVGINHAYSYERIFCQDEYEAVNDQGVVQRYTREFEFGRYLPWTNPEYYQSHFGNLFPYYIYSKCVKEEPGVDHTFPICVSQRDSRYPKTMEAERGAAVNTEKVYPPMPEKYLSIINKFQLLYAYGLEWNIEIAPYAQRVSGKKFSVISDIVSIPTVFYLPVGKVVFKNCYSTF